MKLTLCKIFCTVLLLSLSSHGRAQSLDQAKTLYNEGNYAAAKPAFEKLVRQSPNNASYNQWYGVCCYETRDYGNAEKYLLVAAKKNVMEAHRYLAMTYTQTERYDDAIPAWEDYIALQIKKKEDVTASQNNLERIRKLARMMQNAEDVQVIDSMVVDKEDFLKTYFLSEESGSLTTYSAFFGTSDDVSSTVYKNQKGDRIYYAKPSENKTYTLFLQDKLLDKFGEEKTLLASQNTDDNYPFILSDGITMYFASKGYGSIGGYDIFVTRYNLNTNAYLAPEQLGMPFNSLANDYMMVIDEAKNLGWFVSDRNQPDDKVCVYLFIPQEKKTNIGSEDPEVLKTRAMLSSIASTWKEGSDYAALVKLARKSPNQTPAKPESDFTFVVNDKTVYHTLDEIKNDGTKNLYAEFLEKTKQVAAMQKKLDDLRDDYHKGNSSKRSQLAPTIKGLEKELFHLTEEAEAQEKKARNAENRRLGVKY